MADDQLDTQEDLELQAAIAMSLVRYNPLCFVLFSRNIAQNQNRLVKAECNTTSRNGFTTKNTLDSTNSDTFRGKMSPEKNEEQKMS